MNLPDMIKKLEDRRNLEIYTDWEQGFLRSVVEDYHHRGSLTQGQIDKIKEIIRERWIMGI